MASSTLKFNCVPSFAYFDLPWCENMCKGVGNKHFNACETGTKCNFRGSTLNGNMHFFFFRSKVLSCFYLKYMQGSIFGVN